MGNSVSGIPVVSLNVPSDTVFFTASNARVVIPDTGKDFRGDLTVYPEKILFVARWNLINGRQRKTTEKSDRHEWTTVSISDVQCKENSDLIQVYFGFTPTTKTLVRFSCKERDALIDILTRSSVQAQRNLNGYHYTSKVGLDIAENIRREKEGRDRADLEVTLRGEMKAMVNAAVAARASEWMQTAFRHFYVLVDQMQTEVEKQFLDHHTRAEGPRKEDYYKLPRKKPDERFEEDWVTHFEDKCGRLLTTVQRPPNALQTKDVWQNSSASALPVHLTKHNEAAENLVCQHKSRTTWNIGKGQDEAFAYFSDRDGRTKATGIQEKNSGRTAFDSFLSKIYEQTNQPNTTVRGQGSGRLVKTCGKGRDEAFAYFSDKDLKRTKPKQTSSHVHLQAREGLVNTHDKNRLRDFDSFLPKTHEQTTKPNSTVFASRNGKLMETYEDQMERSLGMENSEARPTYSKAHSHTGVSDHKPILKQANSEKPGLLSTFGQRPGSIRKNLT